MHRHRVDEHVLELDVRVPLTHLAHDFPPEARRGQHVGFVDARDLVAAGARELEPKVRHPRHLVLVVVHGVDGLAAAVDDAALLWLAEVGAAGQLADGEDVDALQHIGLDGGGVRERVVHLRRTQVRPQSQCRADTEDPLLRPHGRAGVIPLRPTDGAPEHRVRRERRLDGLRPQRHAVRIDGRAADEVLSELERVAEAPADRLEGADPLGGDFGADAVAWKHKDAEVAHVDSSQKCEADTTTAAALAPDSCVLQRRQYIINPRYQ